MFGNLLMSANGTKCSTKRTTVETDPFGDGSLVHSFRFEDNLYDEITGLVKTDAGSHSFDNAKFSRGFVSSGSQVQIEEDFAINHAACTTSFWMDSSSSYDGSDYICQYAKGSNRGIYRFHDVTNNLFKIRAWIYTTLGTTVFSDYVTISALDQGMQFVTVSHDSAGGIKIWANGVLMLTQTLGTENSDATNGNFILGVVSAVKAIPLIDQYMIFNRIILDSEVSYLYSMTEYVCYADPTPQDYVAYYPLTGTAEDKTGSYNGTENGGLLYVDDTVRGAVANFDGVDDYVDLGANVDWRMQSFSITAWVDIDSLLPSTLAMVSAIEYDYVPGQGQQGSTLAIDPNHYIKYQYTKEDDTDVIILSTVPVSGKVMVGVTIGTNVSIYIDGGLDISTLFGGIQYTTSALHSYLGCIAQEDVIKAISKINMGSIRLYPRELSAEEILTIYNYEKVTHPVPVDNGLIAYYPFASNSWDNYFNQYDCTDVGGVTYDGISAFFDNTDNYIESNSAINLDYASSWSASMWCKFSSISDIGIVLQTLDGTGTGRTLINYSLSFNSIVSAFGGVLSDTGITPIINQWYFLSLTYDSSTNTFVIYIDKTPYSFSIIGETNVGKVRFGADKVLTSANFLHGYLGHCRLYDRVISPTEIETIYNSERGDFGI